MKMYERESGEVLSSRTTAQVFQEDWILHPRVEKNLHGDRNARRVRGMAL
jgi:hypothetical protein